MGLQEYQGAKANGEDDYMCVKIKAEVRSHSTNLILVHGSRSHSNHLLSLSPVVATPPDRPSLTLPLGRIATAGHAAH